MIYFYLQTKIHYVFERTIGFETNIKNNGDSKATKYSSLINNLSFHYSTVYFVNLSMSALGLWVLPLILSSVLVE